MAKINKKIVLSVLLFLIIIAVIIILIVPAYKEIKDKEKKIEMYQTQKKTMSDFYSFSSSNFAKLKEAGWLENKEIVESNFISSPFFFSKINYFLRNLSFENGLVFSSLSNSTPLLISESQLLYKGQIMGPVKKTSFNLSVDGSYASFKSFLKSLESQARIATIQSISILPASKKTAEESSSELSFNLVVDFYSY